MSGFTDQFGRTITFSTDGTTDTYTGVGLTVQFPSGNSQPRALAAFNGMPPGAPAVPATTTIDAADFISRLTPAEQAAVMTADPLWAIKIAAQGVVDVTNPVLLATATQAVAAGLLTQARLAQILNLSQSSP